MKKKERVVVLGASDNPARYSNMALCSLMEKGYEAIPIHPSLKKIKGVRVLNKLEDVEGRVDTVTVYVNSKRSSDMVESIVSLKPRRIIVNPGAESEKIKEASERGGIEYVEACTLVMLSTNQF